MDQRLAALVIPFDARLIDAVQAIKENKNRCVVVVSGDKVVGVLSEGDVMRALLHGADVHSPLEVWISHDFKFLSDANDVGALELMRCYGITLVPVLDVDFSLRDVVTLADILQRVSLPESAK